jgi:hypothetical protein
VVQQRPDRRRSPRNGRVAGSSARTAGGAVITPLAETASSAPVT